MSFCALKFAVDGVENRLVKTPRRKECLAPSAGFEVLQRLGNADAIDRTA